MSGPLIEALKEVKATYDAGLLNAEEYAAAKKDVMARFASAAAASSVKASVKPTVAASAAPTVAKPSGTGTGGGGGSGGGAATASTAKGESLDARYQRLVLELNDVKAKMGASPTETEKVALKAQLVRLLADMKATNNEIAAAAAAGKSAPSTATVSALQKAAADKKNAIEAADKEEEEERLASEKRRAALQKQLDDLRAAAAKQTVAATVTATQRTTASATAAAQLAELDSKKAVLTASVAASKAKVADKVKKQVDSVDVCFVMDLTGSMGPFMKACRDKICAIVNDVKAAEPNMNLRLAFIGYRNVHDEKSGKRFSVVTFTDNPFIIKNHVAALQPEGGGDGLCDIAGAYAKVLALEWKAMSRLMIHIGDAPCHGSQFHDGLHDDYPGGDPDGHRPEDQLPKIKALKIDFTFTRIANLTDTMTNAFAKLYNGAETDAAHKLKIVALDGDAKNFMPTMVATIKSSISASKMDLTRMMAL